MKIKKQRSLDEMFVKFAKMKFNLISQLITCVLLQINEAGTFLFIKTSNAFSVEDEDETGGIFAIHLILKELILKTACNSRKDTSGMSSITSLPDMPVRRISNSSSLIVGCSDSKDFVKTLSET